MTEPGSKIIDEIEYSQVLAIKKTSRIESDLKVEPEKVDTIPIEPEPLLILGDKLEIVIQPEKILVSSNQLEETEVLEPNPIEASLEIVEFMKDLEEEINLIIAKGLERDIVKGSPIWNEIFHDPHPFRDSQSTMDLVPIDPTSTCTMVRTCLPFIVLKHRSLLNHVYPKDFHAIVHVLKFWREYLLLLENLLYPYPSTFKFYNS